MTAPRLVCAGCGDPTTLHKPVCDECVRFLRVELDYRYCALCDYWYPLNASRTLHIGPDGAYLGRCERSFLAMEAG